MIVDAHLDIGWNAISSGRGFLLPPAPGYVVSRSSLVAAEVGLVFATLYTAPARATRSMRTRFVYENAHEANLMATAQVNYYKASGLDLIGTRDELAAYARNWRKGRLAAILRDAQPMVVKIPEVDLRRGIARMGAQIKKVKGFRCVLANTTTFEIQNAQVVERWRVATIGRRVEPIQSMARVRLCTPPRKRGNRQVHHGGGIPLLRLFRKDFVNFLFLPGIEGAGSRSRCGGLIGRVSLPTEFLDLVHAHRAALRKDQSIQIRWNTGRRSSSACLLLSKRRPRHGQESKNRERKSKEQT